MPALEPSAEEIRVVDQIGSPTWTGDIASFADSQLKYPDKSGNQ